MRLNSPFGLFFFFSFSSPFPLPLLTYILIWFIACASIALSPWIFIRPGVREAGKEIGHGSGCGKVPLPYQGGEKVNPPGVLLAVKCREVSQGAKGSLGVHFGSVPHVCRT